MKLTRPLFYFVEMKLSTIRRYFIPYTNPASISMKPKSIMKNQEPIVYVLYALADL